MLQAVASTRFGEAAEALESLGDPEVLLRLVGSVATAISAAEVLAALQKQTHAAQPQAAPKDLARRILPGRY
jgi:hypothetical protein